MQSSMPTSATGSLNERRIGRYSSGNNEPIIVVREPNIVVMPLDSSSHSEYAAHFYLKYIHRPENKDTRKRSLKRCYLYCCGKYFNKVVLDVGPSPGMLAELEKTDRENYQKVKSLTKTLFGVNNVNYELRRLSAQDPGMAIIAFRKEIHGTLIVMGSRGIGALKRSIFGSVSDKILHNSIVPVLVVKKPEGAMSSFTALDHTTAIY